MKIRVGEIERYAARYPLKAENDVVCIPMRSAAQSQGHLNKPQFLVITDWKTERLKSKTRQNTNDEVMHYTRAALQLIGPEAIKPLLSLQGVGLPTASCILHYCHPQSFPIIDYRALWTLDIPYRNTSYRGWVSICDAVGRLHQETGLDYRTIDRALWMYSRIHQERQ
jgi:hypothetical protein